jgi:mRNA-degrading endonuclease YafQ of YafQ-DinJ toxin-antitoxin module
MISIQYSTLFKKKVQGLTPEVKKSLRAKLELLIENPQHPSLRTKKIQGAEGIFEASITMAVRLTFQYMEDGAILLRNIGEHDKTLKNP